MCKKFKIHCCNVCPTLGWLEDGTYICGDTLVLIKDINKIDKSCVLLNYEEVKEI